MFGRPGPESAGGDPHRPDLSGLRMVGAVDVAVADPDNRRPDKRRMVLAKQRLDKVADTQHLHRDLALQALAMRVPAAKQAIVSIAASPVAVLGWSWMKNALAPPLNWTLSDARQ